MSRSRENFKSGTISVAGITSGSTTVSSAEFASLATIAAPTVAYLVFDPQAVYGAPEIVKVTTHTAAATSATIARGQLGTSARSHILGTQWVQSLLVDDPAFLDAANTFTADQTLNNAHLLSTGTAPSVAVGSGAGTGATASVSGTDCKGIVTVNTGTGTIADQALVTLTFATAYGAAPAVVLTPSGVNAAASSLYIATAPAAGSCVVQGHVTPTASATLKFTYLVIG